ncbi:SsrA-binding protein SmpB, partial [Candidatus Roizmanbacteria bacterium]|nr:SsrA-binding protein SmpB [Candidatus Roizmanbacteria bacterium]
MKIINRQARFEYHILDTLEAGIVLTGAEVKSIKNGRIQLSSSFIRIMSGEAYLINADIPVYEYAKQENYDSKRSRKLLLRKNQLISLSTKLDQQKLTLVPVSCYTTRGLVKLEIGLGKRKQEKDKREEIRKRDLERETQRALR